MHVRIPPTSHSLRRVLLELCQNQEVEISTLQRLNQCILASNTDDENWSVLTGIVDHVWVLRALAAVCETAQTGPVTAFVITRLMEDSARHQQVRAEARRDAADMELKRQRSGQAFLAACEWFL